MLSAVSLLPHFGFANITTFTFKVTYTDADNNAPTSIVVRLNGTNENLTKQVLTDTNYITGVVYVLATTIRAAGIYTYNFTASDGAFFNRTATFTDLTVNASTPLFTAGSQYQWTGWTDLWGTKQATGGFESFVNAGTPGLLKVNSALINGGRTINATSVIITAGTWFLPGAHEFVRIFPDIGVGSTVAIAVWNDVSGDQIFTGDGRDGFCCHESRIRLLGSGLS